MTNFSDLCEIKFWASVINWAGKLSETRYHNHKFCLKTLKHSCSCILLASLGYKNLYRDTTLKSETLLKFLLCREYNEQLKFFFEITSMKVDK